MLITHLNRLDGTILMSAHNIQFRDKIRKISLNMCSLQLSEEFQKRVRMSHGKRAIGVRAIEVQLYVSHTHASVF